MSVVAATTPAASAAQTVVEAPGVAHLTFRVVR